MAVLGPAVHRLKPGLQQSRLKSGLQPKVHFALILQNAAIGRSFDCMKSAGHADITEGGKVSSELGGGPAMKSSQPVAFVILMFVLASMTNLACANDGPSSCANCKNWCPDDYQCKPLPKCPPPICFGLPDDYCLNRFPNARVPAYLGCDDCCKSLPKCPFSASVWYMWTPAAVVDAGYGEAEVRRALNRPKTFVLCVWSLT